MGSRMFATNEGRLLRIPVEVQPVHPGRWGSYRVGHDGAPHAVPGVGGIVTNLRVGDPALGWVADHAEPCVTARHKENDRNGAVAFLSCIGNTATVICGDAKGARGVVTGKHGGVEHLMIDFPNADLKELAYGDTIRVDTFGQGLSIEETPDVKLMSLDPRLLKHPSWPIARDGTTLVVPVAKIVPARIMGSGLGSDVSFQGDYDIQLFDAATVEEYGLCDLRLGDIVAIMDADHSYGRIYRTGAVSISIVSHADCITAGHGPGATTLMTSPGGAIRPVVDASANLRTVIDADRRKRRTATKAKRKAARRR